MFDAIRGCDEWLAFGWEGSRFAAPNAGGHLIEMAAALGPGQPGGAAASFFYRGGNRPIHWLDGQLRAVARPLAFDPNGHKEVRPLFVFFGGLPQPFGLLCEQADVMRASERRWRCYELPAALRRPGSPLMGVAWEVGARPVLLCTTQSLQEFLAQSNPTGDKGHLAPRP